jgi:hypothetical protein
MGLLISIISIQSKLEQRLYMRFHGKLSKSNYIFSQFYLVNHEIHRTQFIHEYGLPNS